MKSITIYGAGMAGLLAANFLRRYDPQIKEAQKSLPSNHSALLRFRADGCSKVTNVPFSKVSVQKAIKFNGTLLDKSNITVCNLYSRKVTGKVSARSIEDISTVQRYVAPEFFIPLMARQLSIEYGQEFGPQDLFNRTADSDPIISTVPMPTMMRIAGWQDVPEFEYKGIWTLRARVHGCDVNQTIYYPDPGTPYYRASITKNVLVVELLTDPAGVNVEWLESVLDDFGTMSHMITDKVVQFQKYGKLVAGDEKKCRAFMTFLTARYNIYSLGRFATWRQILLDDVLHDVAVIEKMFSCQDDYQQSLHKIK